MEFVLGLYTARWMLSNKQCLLLLFLYHITIFQGKVREFPRDISIYKNMKLKDLVFLNLLNISHLNIGMPKINMFS